MLRERVRPRWTDQQLSEIYARPFDQNALGWGADARVVTTATIGRLLYVPEVPTSIADLSCGNGDIARRIAVGDRHVPLYLGDFAAGYQFTGPMEQTIDEMRDPVDLFVCAETLEHLWDPELVLDKVRSKANKLVCSVPLWERAEQEQNGEHYWAFDREGFEAMLDDTGWTPVLFAEVPSYPVGGHGGTYQCGIWGCE
jgi:hypothetical protein